MSLDEDLQKENDLQWLPDVDLGGGVKVLCLVTCNHSITKCWNNRVLVINKRRKISIRDLQKGQKCLSLKGRVAMKKLREQ
uniref:SFRICE_036096 n=1 Tax=Spodoptera frugiperda TaxID=7108 RepID=A0A2H1WBD7_SPOFR